ncbi:MBL fold metallo-hydrolase [Proteiniclasticum sp. C24MP]|uniref:MBL fold metallo-hydrolase n=1 Tax=Proteiniclasticum sp. C24MP TaxID=3374101 RepID=UPI0037547926
MRIAVLLENDKVKDRDELLSAHGVSFYIESMGRKMIFDFGPDARFLENARMMNIPLEEVDLAFLSHGHQDHAGGIPAFLKVNSKAPIYAHPKAMDKHYSRQENGIMKDIITPEEVSGSSRFILVEGITRLDAHLTLISQITGEEMMPPGNETLYMREGEEYLRDDFRHEHNLLLEEEGKLFLIIGCGHRGVVNLVETVKKIKGRYPDHVIGGFHIKKPSKIHPDETFVPRLGEKLKETGIQYHTCHCTGQKMYRKLQETMGAQVDYLVTGEDLTL